MNSNHLQIIQQTLQNNSTKYNKIQKKKACNFSREKPTEQQSLPKSRNQFHRTTTTHNTTKYKRKIIATLAAEKPIEQHSLPKSRSKFHRTTHNTITFKRKKLATLAAENLIQQQSLTKSHNKVLRTTTHNITKYIRKKQRKNQRTTMTSQITDNNTTITIKEIVFANIKKKTLIFH